MEVATRINGHKAEQPSIAPPATHQITLYRVQGAEAIFIKTLTEDYRGLFTHYKRPESLVCTGENCRHALHGIKRVWKGYVPILINIPKTPRWVPYCFEITEHLELDLRGVWARGQTWEIYRDVDKKSKNGPVHGKLHADATPENLPAPFNIVPCLRAVYHTDVIDLCHKSPLPPRVYIEAVEMPAPEVTKPNKVQELPDDYSFTEEFQRRQKQAAQTRTSPSERKRPYS